MPSKSTTAKLINEMDKLRDINALIDFTIQTTFREWPHRKMKKGAAHTIIANRLKIKLSPLLRAIINKRMEKQGYDTVIRDGYKFFNHIEVMPEE